MHTLVARAGCAGATLRTAKGSDEAGNRGGRLTLILNAVENVAVHAAQPDVVGRGKDVGIYEKVQGCIGKMRSRAQKSLSIRVAITPHPCVRLLSKTGSNWRYGARASKDCKQANQRSFHRCWRPRLSAKAHSRPGRKRKYPERDQQYQPNQSAMHHALNN